ncbi:MAG: hypothetical protein ACLRIL_05530 [Fusicatenibacter saccharivorans]
MRGMELLAGCIEWDDEKLRHAAKKSSVRSMARSKRKTSCLGKIKEQTDEAQKKEQKENERKTAASGSEEEKKKKSEQAEKEAEICEQLEERIREEKACLELLRKVQQEQVNDDAAAKGTAGNSGSKSNSCRTEQEHAKKSWNSRKHGKNVSPVRRRNWHGRNKKKRMPQSRCSS